MISSVVVVVVVICDKLIALLIIVIDMCTRLAQSEEKMLSCVPTKLLDSGSARVQELFI